LGWTEEHVDERAEERREEPEQRREGDDPRAVDPPPRVLERPVADREPEDGADRDQRRPRDRPCTRREEVGEEENRQDGRHYKSSLPIMYPAKKASPTKTARAKAANRKTLRRPLRWDTGPREGRGSR